MSNNGYYGENKTNKKWYAKFIEYKYTLEYSPDSNIEEILKSVENTISNSIITGTSIFAECSGVGNRVLMEQTQVSFSSRNLEEDNDIAAISSMPPDEATSEECPLVEASNEVICTVVAGVLTVFYRSETSHAESEQEIHTIVEDVLSGQDLISSNTQIKNLRFIESSNNMPNKDSEFQNKNLVVILSVASSATIILSLGLIVIKWRQHKRNKHDGCSHNKPYSTVTVGQLRNNRIEQNMPERALMDDDSIMSSEDNEYLARVLEYGHLKCPVDGGYLKCLNDHEYRNGSNSSLEDIGFIRNLQDERQENSEDNTGHNISSQDDRYRIRVNPSKATTSDIYANYLNSFTHENRTYSEVTWTSAI